MEVRVDFDGIEFRGIACEMAPLSWKARGKFTPNSPACRSD